MKATSRFSSPACRLAAVLVAVLLGAATALAQLPTPPGKVTIAEPNPASSYRLVVEGSGKIGFMKGSGLLTLEPREQSTTVHFEGEVQVGGTIAAVGQRLIDTTSRMLIKRFFEKLAKEAEQAATA